MQASDLSLSIRNTIFVYSALALYGLLTVVLIAYVHAKFRTAAKSLKLVQSEWQTAQSKHDTFVGDAQEKLSKLRATPAAATVLPPRTSAIGPDARRQIVAMAKRGMKTNDIARNCGLHEGEVEVILGMARLERL